MTLTLINRSRFFHDKNKKGSLIVDSGYNYLNPMKVTSKKGRPAYLAWVRRYNLSLVTKGNYFLNKDGLLYKIEGWRDARLTEEITVGEYLTLIDLGQVSHWSGYLHTYTLKKKEATT